MKKLLYILSLNLLVTTTASALPTDSLQSFCTKISSSSWKFQGEYINDSLAESNPEKSRFLFDFSAISGTLTGSLITNRINQDSTYMDMGAASNYEVLREAQTNKVMIRFYSAETNETAARLYCTEITDTRFILYNSENQHSFIYIRPE